MGWIGPRLIDRLAIPAVVVSLGLCASLAEGRAATWSFDDHPQPVIEELARDYRSWIESVRTGEWGSCSRTVGILYAIYQATYPDFDPQTAPAALFTSWKRHVVSRSRDIDAECILTEAENALFAEERLIAVDSIRYCGRFTSEPTTFIQRLFAERIGDLVSYAETGHPHAINSLLAAETLQNVDLNFDVVYFILRVRERAGLARTEASIAAAGLEGRLVPDSIRLELAAGELDAERRAFLDDAAKSLDIKRVLETTLSCS